MRISDGSSDVCSSDLPCRLPLCEYQGLAGIKDVSELITELIGICSQYIPAKNAGLVPLQYLGATSAKFIRHLYRSAERRVGKECVSPCRSRWSPYHNK